MIVAYLVPVQLVRWPSSLRWGSVILVLPVVNKQTPQQQLAAGRTKFAACWKIFRRTAMFPCARANGIARHFCRSAQRTFNGPTGQWETPWCRNNGSTPPPVRAVIPELNVPWVTWLPHRQNADQKDVGAEMSFTYLFVINDCFLFIFASFFCSFFITFVLIFIILLPFFQGVFDLTQ